MFELVVYDGRTVSLPPGQAIELGRQHVKQRFTATYVARVQCTVVADENGAITVTSCSKTNPTRVIRTSGQLQDLLLREGESTVISQGDKIILLATEPKEFLQVRSVACHDAGTADVLGVAEYDLQDEPTAKRLRADGTSSSRQQCPATGHHLPAAATTVPSPLPVIIPPPHNSPAPSRQPPAPMTVASAVHEESAAGVQPSPVGGPASTSQAAPDRGLDKQAEGGAVARATGQRHVVILVGVPGSGKSTFCDRLRAAASGTSWQRVNQDSIASGKKGTRKQCVTAAKRALMRGDNVLVDRCNFDKDQRADFIALATQHSAQAHAVVLDLPADVAAERAVQRVAHEGGVEGPTAKAVVYRMSSQMKKAGPSSTDEGLASIMVCTSDGDVDAALEAWAQVGCNNAQQPLAYWQAARAQARSNQKCKTPHSASQAPPRVQQQAATSNSRKQQQLSEKRQSTPSSKGRQQLSQEPQQPAATSASRQRQALQSPPSSAAKQHPPGTPPPLASAFAVLMASSKANLAKASPPAKAGPARTQPASQWQDALRRVALSPDEHREACVHVDEQCVVILDAYPKARCHALVVARDAALLGPKDLRSQHVPLMLHMKEVGRSWADRQQLQQPHALDFKLGFHSIPSMRQLHLHVISQDFLSDALKNKKHWNSFTTPFFLPVDDALRQIDQQGALHIDEERAAELLKGPLRCHRCGAVQKDMPTLKSHIRGCGGK